MFATGETSWTTVNPEIGRVVADKFAVAETSGVIAPVGKATTAGRVVGVAVGVRVNVGVTGIAVAVGTTVIGSHAAAKIAKAKMEKTMRS